MEEFEIVDGELKKYLGTSNVVKIPEIVTKIGDKAFFDNHTVEKIDFPSTLTRIGRYSFCGCDELQSVKIPEGVFKISASAFLECKLLKDVELPSTLEILSKESFKDCVSLEKIEIPDSVKIIEESVFSNCSGLKLVKLPNKIEKIPDELFLGCENLKNINIPDSVVSIGGSAFSMCKSLEIIKFPKNLKMINIGAFEKCENLRSVDLSETSKQAEKLVIEECAFADCTSLIEIKLPKNSEVWSDAFCNCLNISDDSKNKIITQFGEKFYSNAFTEYSDIGFEQNDSIDEENQENNVFDDKFYKYLELAKAGDSTSQYKVGAEYLTKTLQGEGYYKKEALEWAEKSAEQNNPDGMNLAGCIYLNLFNEKQKAIDYYLRASLLGSEKAKENLKVLNR